MKKLELSLPVPSRDALAKNSRERDERLAQLVRPVDGRSNVTKEEGAAILSHIGVVGMASGRPIDAERSSVMLQLLTARYDSVWILWALKKLSYEYDGAYNQPLTVKHVCDVIEEEMKRQEKARRHARAMEPLYPERRALSS